MRSCGWCNGPLGATASALARFCGQKCRQAAFRLRRSSETLARAAKPLRVAYADPPYPGMAKKYYGSEEVDHEALIASLEASENGYDGWALSTSSKSLRDVLPICPPGVRVAAWVKPISASPRTKGPHSTWEPVIVKPARLLQPGVRDWLSAQPARSGGTLPGRKPIAFCAWLFRLLGMRPGDELLDLFPGTGIVARSWRELSRGSSSDEASSEYSRHRSGSSSATSLDNASLFPGGDGASSFGYRCDKPSLAAAEDVSSRAACNVASAPRGDGS